MSSDLIQTDREAKNGFVVQTLVYTDRFELQRLGASGKERMEEAVAIVLDDDNRLKRCQFNRGYIHERREREGLQTVAVFADLDELQASQIYTDYLANLPESAGKI